jgi:peptidoglycan-associated lipoprotein
MQKMKFLSKVLMISLLLVVAAGCASKKKVGAGEAGELTEEQLAAEREARFGEGAIPTAEGGGLFKDVFFDYDSSVVNFEGREAIAANAQILKSRPGLAVTIEGHCDERGTAEYNMALGNARARAVRTLLISYGVEGSRVQTISYGEEVPLDLGHDESAWAKNRRAHFSAMAGAGN